MASRLTLKSVNDELARLELRARLQKASNYFYFFGGEAADWIDRTVPIAKISDLPLTGWIEQFHRLRKVNAEIMREKPRGIPRKSRRPGT